MMLPSSTPESISLSDSLNILPIMRLPFVVHYEEVEQDMRQLQVRRRFQKPPASTPKTTRSPRRLKPSGMRVP